MLKSRPVDVLPKLNQADFPALPQVPEGRVLLIFQSEWRNAEKEWAAGVVITACVRKGQWYPVSTEDFAAVLSDRHFTFSKHDVIEGLWSLMALSCLEVVKFESRDYIIPKPQLAKVALTDSSKLRYTNRS